MSIPAITADMKPPIIETRVAMITNTQPPILNTANVNLTETIQFFYKKTGRSLILWLYLFAISASRQSCEVASYSKISS